MQHINIDEKMKKSLLAEQRTHRRAKSRRVLESAILGTFGALSTLLAKMEREYLVALGGFTEHTTFVLGEPLVCPETKQVTVAMSTENLLLNAYRQADYGLPKLVCVDTTHRLIVERTFALACSVCAHAVLISESLVRCGVRS